MSSARTTTTFGRAGGAAPGGCALATAVSALERADTEPLHEVALRVGVDEDHRQGAHDDERVLDERRECLELVRVLRREVRDLVRRELAEHEDLLEDELQRVQALGVEEDEGVEVAVPLHD